MSRLTFCKASLGIDMVATIERIPEIVGLGGGGEGKTPSEVLRLGMEHKRLKEEQEAAEEEERRKKEAELAVERYKQKEAERIKKEREERELADKEYQRRLQEQLVASGVDEKDIAAIMKKEKVRAAEAEAQNQQTLSRPMYTRMPRKHLSIETLRQFHIEWDWDQVRPCQHVVCFSGLRVLTDPARMPTTYLSSAGFQNGSRTTSGSIPVSCARSEARLC